MVLDTSCRFEQDGKVDHALVHPMPRRFFPQLTFGTNIIIACDLGLLDSVLVSPIKIKGGSGAEEFGQAELSGAGRSIH